LPIPRAEAEESFDTELSEEIISNNKNMDKGFIFEPIQESIKFVIVHIDFNKPNETDTVFPLVIQRLQIAHHIPFGQIFVYQLTYIIIN